MRYIVLFTIGLSIFLSCSIPDESNRKNDLPVVVIFRDAISQLSTDRFIGSTSIKGRGTINYVDETMNLVQYTPCSHGHDTIVIPSYEGYAEVLHLYQAIEEIPYLLMAGDTVLFTYDTNLRPRIKSLTSDYKTEIYNLSTDDDRCIHSSGYSTNQVLASYEYRRAYEIVNSSEISRCPQSILDKILNFYVDLDSLQVVYDTYVKDFHHAMDSLKKSGFLPDAYYRYYMNNIIGEKPAINELVGSSSDSLLHYVSNYVRVLNYPFKGITEYDPPMLFNMAVCDTTLSDTAKRIILKKIMSDIIYSGSPFSTETVTKHLNEYIRQTGDTATFRQTYYEIDELSVCDVDGNECSFANLLSRFVGKVIYVDFWASWCRPCRYEVPFSINLNEKYSNKNVVFLYVAIHDTEEQWKQAIKELGLNQVGNLFMVVDSKDDVIFNKLNINTIPRYMIFDSQGFPVNRNAPRPSSEDIERELDKYLSAIY